MCLDLQCVLTDSVRQSVACLQHHNKSVSKCCEMMPGLSCEAKQTSLAFCDAQEQGNSDSTLDDVACLLGCTRSSLHGENSFVYLV